MSSREYVQQVLTLYEQSAGTDVAAAVYRELLQRGQTYTDVDRPQSERLSSIYRTQPKQCFYNCQMIAIASDGRYTYAEGFATGIIPVHHAWLIDADGMIVEPTWTAGLGYTPDSGPGDYFGITLPAPFLAERMLRTGEAAGQVWAYLMRTMDPPAGMDPAVWARKAAAV